MIYTVTFNPSLDYVVHMDDFHIGIVNRTTYEEVLEGGKGINVSIVLNNLGIPNVALGFIAGFTGKHIEESLKKRGCQTDFITMREGISRINVKMKGMEETEINGQGPDISERDIALLFEKMNLFTEGDILVLAGSIPSSLPSSIYEQIMEYLQERGIKIVVDATKELLLNVLKYHPFLIKPNNHELGEMFQMKLESEKEIITYARRLQDMGARNVLISRASKGAILISEEGTIYESPAPKGKVVNSVGAGDSMVAGFLTGYITTQDYREAFKMGVATGSASAFSSQLAVKEEVYKLLENLE